MARMKYLYMICNVVRKGQNGSISSEQYKLFRLIGMGALILIFFNSINITFANKVKKISSDRKNDRLLQFKQ